MTKVTYLLGAGASYEAVPVVGEMEQRVFNIHNALCNGIYEHDKKEIREVKKGEQSKRWREHKHIIKLKEAEEAIKSSDPVLLDTFNKDLNWLYTGMKNHTSVDTFAKKLWLKEEDRSFNQLKHILAAYLTIEQIINPPDQRYDKFYATILRSNKEGISDGIKIISWNYDFQFELAYNDYSLYDNLVENSSELDIITKMAKNIDNGGFSKASINKFSINKLNGTAGILNHKNEVDYTLGLMNKNIEGLLRRVLKTYHDSKKVENIERSAISFAWEDESNSNQEEKESSIHIKSLQDIARKSIEESTHVVVIGYSFPYFNAEVDKKLFQGLDHSRIKYYVQDPESDKVVESLREITGYGSKLNVKALKYTNEFFIPYDFFG